MDMEDCACLICGAENAEAADSVLWRGAELKYVLCPDCGLKYMRPRPTRSWYHAFYEREFWQEKIEYKEFSRKNKAKVDSTTGLGRRIEKQKWRAERIISFLSPHNIAPNATVLDCGAAFGVTCHELAERWQAKAFAVEPSLVSREVGEAEFGVNYVARYVEDLESIAKSLPPLDVAILSHVLENLIDPLSALKTIRGMMSPAGLLYIDTCNFFYNNAVNPYHPYIFNPDTLEELLALAGFAVIARHHDPRPRDAHTAGSDPYFVFISRPGASTFKRGVVDARELVAEQNRGLAAREKYLKDKKAVRKKEREKA